MGDRGFFDILPVAISYDKNNKNIYKKLLIDYKGRKRRRWKNKNKQNSNGRKYARSE